MLCRLLFRDLEQPLAPPHADDPDSARIDTVDHSKRRHDDFPQELDAKLGDNAPRQRKAPRFLDVPEDLLKEPFRSLRSGKFAIMTPDLFQIGDGGAGE